MENGGGAIKRNSSVQVIGASEIDPGRLNGFKARGTLGPHLPPTGPEFPRLQDHSPVTGHSKVVLRVSTVLWQVLRYVGM